MWPWETAKQAMEEKILPFIDREAQAIAAQNVANKNLQQAAATSLAQKGWDPEMGIPMVGKTQTQFSQLNPEEKNIISGTNINLVGSLSGGVTSRADEYLNAVGKLASKELPAQQQALEVIKNEAQHQLTPQEYNAVRDWSDQKLVDKIYKRLETERNAVSEAGSKSVDTMPNLLNKTDNAQSTLSDTPLYHGSPNEIIGGELKYGMKNGQDAGGIFLTDNKDVANTFTFGRGKVYEAPSGIKKEVIDLTQKDGIDLFKKQIGKTYTSFDGENLPFTQQDFDLMFPGGKTDFASVSQYPELVQQVVDEAGKRGIAFNEYAGGKIGKTYQILSGNVPVTSQLHSLQSISSKAMQSRINELKGVK